MSTQERGKAEFADHVIARETGWTWRCRKPGTGIYAYRVTWCPGNLMVTGDIGDVTVTHYSFDDPWSAAAWINGAGWSYFMEKTHVGKEYDAEATAKGIVESAYRGWRDGYTALMERVVEHHPYRNDVNDRDDRKEACRELLSGELSETDAYDITEDSEAIVYAYPERYRLRYAALKLWANWMWENEPAWHKAQRVYRRLRREIKDLREGAIWAPVLYRVYDEKGRPTSLNGATHWRWRAHWHGAGYQAVYPLKLFGYSLDRFGWWRNGGHGWPDDPKDRRHLFRDVRPGGFA